MSKTCGLTIEQVREAVKATLHEELQAVDVGVSISDHAVALGTRILEKLSTIDELLVLISRQNTVIIKGFTDDADPAAPLEATVPATETPAPPAPEAEA